MGDVSTEPSMEDILSSIKRIIAEEGETPAKPRRQTRPAAARVEAAADDAEEVLELNEPIDAAPEPAPQPKPAPIRVAAPAAQPAPAPAPAAPIVSHQAAAATRGSLDTLSKLMIKPEPASDGTLEGLVREMLRPMLSEWLDAHLPALVETMVEREIARITAERG